MKFVALHSELENFWKEYPESCRRIHRHLDRNL